ncbi:MAG: EipA family protein [Syntrophales bacterium]
MKKVFVVLVSIIFAISIMGLAIAQTAAEKPKPDATLKMSEGQFAVGIGWSWGKGVLTYKGEKYKFKVKGLSVIDVGISKATSSGKVYNLKQLSDFNGVYTAVAAQGTLAGGAGVTTMKNQNGVVLEVVSTTQGVNLKLAAEGVSFTLEK